MKRALSEKVEKQVKDSHLVRAHPSGTARLSGFSARSIDATSEFFDNNRSELLEKIYHC